MQEYIMFAKVQDGTHSMTQQQQIECIEKIKKLRDEVDDLKKSCRSMIKCLIDINSNIDAELMRHGE